ncbi:MAG TPA: hypothetical protein VFT22_30900 [Kofleriaceae bacterium]|nr:hypothetical protein [Kofleriaceae bacterium]
MHEPISRWYALLVVLASLPFACIVLLVGLATRSFWIDVGLAWISVLGLVALVVQVGVAALNRVATSERLPRAQVSPRRAR